jgi:hypothetical protein
LRLPQVLVLLDLGYGIGEQRPDLAAGDPGSDFDAIRARLPLDLDAPGIRILDLIERPEHLAVASNAP